MVGKLVYGWKLKQVEKLVVDVEQKFRVYIAGAGSLADMDRASSLWNVAKDKLQSKLEKMHGDCPYALELRIKSIYNL